METEPSGHKATVNYGLRLIVFGSWVALSATSFVGQQNSSGPVVTNGTADSPNVVKKLDKSHYLWPGPGIAPPKPLATPLPAYSEIAPRGKTVLCIGIGETGRVEQIQILTSLTKDFDEYAVKTASQWTFAPATKDGKAVPVYLDVDFDSKTVNRETGGSH